jgi:hypothetical protein
MKRNTKRALTQVERERITDSRLKIQSVADSLKNVDPNKVQNLEEIQECLDEADASLRGSLAADRERPSN